jgi:hypothetical protein
MTDVTATKPPAKRLPPSAGRGRKKGELNKFTRVLKDAVLLAAEAEGGSGGLVSYLRVQARKKNAAPFLALLAKILPTQLSNDPENPVGPKHEVTVRFVSTDND